MKRVRPAFVVTVSASASVMAAVACNTPPQDPVIGMNPPAPSVNENTNPPRAIDLDASTTAVTPSATSTAPTPTTAPTDTSGVPTATSNPPPPIEWADYSGQKAFNPVDAQKRTIFSNGPNGCYVILPPPPNAPSPTSFQPPSTKTLPCPKAFQDPVWADCVAGSILPNKAGTECICSPSFGNPPLPPHRIACPKKP